MSSTEMNAPISSVTATASTEVVATKLLHLCVMYPENYSSFISWCKMKAFLACFLFVLGLLKEN